MALGFEPRTACLEGRCSIQLSYATIRIIKSWLSVGVAGFEPATSASQTRRDNRATLHPENKKAERQGLEPWRQLPVDRLAICSITTLAPLLKYVYELIFASANVALELHLHNIFLLFLMKLITSSFWIFNS